MARKEFRQIVRIAGKDLDGDGPIYHELTRVKGISYNFSNMICNLVKIPKTIKASELNEQQIGRIEKVIENPKTAGAPAWMLNRRREPETGEDSHLTSSDLRFIQDNDVKIMKKIKCYKGMRHASNLPARGQRTKSNFRKNKGKVAGVVKKKSAAPAAKSEKKK
jgi:small subunit ribosomal protein S13